MRHSIAVHLVFCRTLLSQSGVSLTMGSLASYLRQQGFRSTLNFFERFGVHNLDQLDLTAKDNVLIVKPNFKDYSWLLPQIEALKSQGLVQRVWLCGTFASLNADSLMSELPWLDGVIIGQPEETASALLSSLRGEHLRWDQQCLGGAWRDPDTGLITAPGPRKSTVGMNELPFPARDLEAKESGAYCNIESSRGCSYKCTFCHVTSMTALDRQADFHARRDPVLVVDEIEAIQRQYGKSLFIFNDSCFWESCHDDKRVMKFCSEIERRGLDIRFYVYLRCTPLVSEPVLAAMAKAGLARVFLGIETVSERSQASYLKRIPANSYERIKDLFDRYDINIHIGYITIEPFASLDEVRRNVRYLRSINKLFRIGVITESVRVVPGTGFQQQLVNSGLLDPALPYDQLTYGYRFAHPEVGELLRGFQTMFRRTLAESAYLFEYWATTADLMRVLAIRLDERMHRLIEPEYVAFVDIRNQTMDLLLRYLEQSIDRAAAGMPADRIGQKFENEQFVTDFQRLSAASQAAYTRFRQAVIANGGQRAVQEVYTGEDRL